MLLSPSAACRKALLLLLIVFVPGHILLAQDSWDEQGKDFVRSAAKNRYKYTVQEIQTVIDQSTTLINSFCKTCSREVQSSLYLARANLLIFQLEYRADSAEGNYKAPPATLSKIRSDFLQAQSFCQSCKCGMLDNITEFYNVYGTQKQLDSLEQEARNIGKPAEHNYIGIDLNFIPQKSIASLGFGFVNAWTVRQPKRWTNSNGKPYRQCKYEYPMAVGYVFLGYERSFTESKYHALKFDPIWLNYIVAVHPAQLLYATGPNGNSLIFRPELGYSFSTLAVNYALNIPFKGDFGFLAQHNVSLRFTIPALKLH